MTPTYVYGIIPTADQIIFDVAGLDDYDDDVYTVPHVSSARPGQDGIAAVVGASPLPDYRGLKRDAAVRYLMVHQQVIEAVMQEFPILPMKFGTVLPDESWVCRLLAQEAGLFHRMLEAFADREQMEVVVLWDVQEVFQEIGCEEPIVQLKAQVAGQPAGPTTAQQVAIGKLVHASLERRRAELRERLVPPLREVALDVVANPPMDDSMVANLALLVDQAGKGALDEQLDALDAMFDGRLTFRCVGPLPPYSFATVEVQVPAFEDVDEARRRLGLGETATPGEIKRAYRRLAGRLHPDHNPDDPTSEARMAEVTEAYQFLSIYAEAVQGSRGASSFSSISASQPLCSFSREAVEQTLLVAVRRQEVSVQEMLRV